MKPEKKRFVDFLQYLKNNDAEIQVNGPGGKKTYFAKTKRNLPSLKNLLIEVLDISENTAGEYLSREAVLDRKNSYKSQISKVGKFIDVIQMHSSKEQAEKKPKRYLHPENTFGVRAKKPQLMRPHRYGASHFLFDGELKDFWTGLYFKKELRQLRVLDTYDMYKNISIATDYKHEFPFDDMMSFHSNSVGWMNDFERKKVKDIYQSLMQEYKSFIEVEEKSNRICLIPGYTDFYYPVQKELCLYHSGIIFDKNEIENLIENSSTRKLVEYRYEVLSKFDFSNEYRDYIDSLGPTYRALLILCYQEFEKLLNTIEIMWEYIKEDLRFIVFSSENNDGTNYQEHDLTVNQLCNLLTNYNFSKTINESFDLTKINIANYRLSKLPDPEVSLNRYFPEELKNQLEQLIEDYFVTKIKKDINLIL